MSIANNPPCGKDCQARNAYCHSGCEKYAAWKAQMEEISNQRRSAKEAAHGVFELTQERKEWLRHRGYKNTGGAR